MKLIEIFKGFFNRQSKNYRLLLIAGVFKRFFEELTMQYRQVYTKILGASSIELGIVNSVNTITRTILSIPSGMLVDKYSLKKLIIVGTGLGTLVPLIYAISFDWRLIIFAMIWQAVAMRIDMPASFTAELVSLNNDARATGRGLHSAITSAFVIIASLAGGFLVTNFGGISVEGIRPLFLIQLFGSVFSILILFYLKDIRLRTEKRKTGIISDMFSIFKTSPHLKLAVVMNVIRMASMELLNPFRNIYMVEFKGADATTLGSIAAIAMTVAFILAIPMGKIADRYSCKKVLPLLMPFYWISLLIIVFAPSREYLLLAGVFDGFNIVSMEVVWGTFIFGLIPLEAHGRWIGISNLFTGIGGVITPIVGGFLYVTAPEFIFFIKIIMEVSLIPLVYILPEKNASE